MASEKTKNPVPLSDILGPFLHKHLQNSDQGFGIRLWQNWSRFATNDILKQSRPVSYQDGRLILWVSHSTELQELDFYTEELKHKINTHFGKQWVREIHFTLNRDILKNSEQTAKLLQDLQD